jgi:hypothetical protein
MFGQIGPKHRILGSRLGQKEFLSPRIASEAEVLRQEAEIFRASFA